MEPALLYNAMFLTEKPRRCFQEQVYTANRNTDSIPTYAELNPLLEDIEPFTPDQVLDSLAPYSHDFNSVTTPSSQQNTVSEFQNVIEDRVPKIDTSSRNQFQFKSK
ncbi:hypothetical protein N7481_013435 [Penicillium waksmanii]|uniref:uncharacterized protein n=1 Tax=Penicillium waksmanii TaxID=69791 RepID=UPI0025495E00|nr:uncharacterized protein N7481_013435 [Penicillium waksmanii]KAJ5963130.1 hypothetical protein N7481_013435 [Penicillium waksmanii]